MNTPAEPIALVPVFASIILLSVMLGCLAAWGIIRFARWLAAKRARRITLLHAHVLRRRP